jgi:hypothetical protein
MRNPDLKFVATYITPKDVVKLDKVADQYGWSRSALMLRAIKVVLDNPKLLADYMAVKVGQ